MENTPASAPKVTSRNLRIFLAVKDSDQRSHMEDSLVMDGFDVRTFSSAATLWDAFQRHPARMVITERRFGGGLSGLDLASSIRKHYLLPYIYVVALSTMSRLQEIKEGLAAGVDDYLIKPPNPLQVRSRVLVGLRWLQYIDSLYEGKA